MKTDRIIGPSATVEFAHQDVQFARARYEGEDEDAFFVQENLAWASWYRIPRADYEAAIARCRADPTTKLIVCEKQTVLPCEVNLAFWPAEADLDTIGKRTVDLIEPQHWGTSVITAPALGHHMFLRGVGNPPAWVDEE